MRVNTRASRIYAITRTLKRPIPQHGGSLGELRSLTGQLNGYCGGDSSTWSITGPTFFFSYLNTSVVICEQ